MYHRISSIAQGRFFEKAPFAEFALKNADKFPHIGNGEDASISTWYINDLCAAYKGNGGIRLSLEEMKAEYCW